MTEQRLKDLEEIAPRLDEYTGPKVVEELAREIRALWDEKRKAKTDGQENKQHGK